jgi:succinate-semialdehyde dehydrogenase / glutarate-semialdehyde dehydrogenase
MTFHSINPADGTVFSSTNSWNEAQLETALSSCASARAAWANTPANERNELLRRAAGILRDLREEFATLVSREMGKLIKESRAEIEKCAWACEFYADSADHFLADEHIATDATRSYVTYQPLGTVLAIMPWNFPFWQVFRFAAPALAAGNTVALKHAANVPLCAQAIEGIFEKAGAPAGLFRTLMIGAQQVAGVIADRRIQAVTLTGSTAAGQAVAAAAGSHLKKSVLELGGSDPFIVLEDADLDHTTDGAVTSRFLNAGQSCIAAKRFIVVDSIATAFVALLKEKVDALTTGNPLDERTTLAPLARLDLRETLHKQVLASIGSGASAVAGCVPISGPGAFYNASILDHVRPGMPAYDEEVFGPVACIVRVRDENEALSVANDSRFGLGASIWTKDQEHGEKLARTIEAGACFVNGIVKSDPRLPFGGIKSSGYGRELSHHGIREFLNIKTLWVR